MIREAAAREADELRADAIRLSAELGQVAAYVTRTLTMPRDTGPGATGPAQAARCRRFRSPGDARCGAAARATARPRPQDGAGPYYTEASTARRGAAGGLRPGSRRRPGRRRPGSQKAEEPESPPAARQGHRAGPLQGQDQPPPGRRPGRHRRTGRCAGRLTWGALAHPASGPDRHAARDPGHRRRPARPATSPREADGKERRSRQARTMHAFAGTITALVVLALGTGAYQSATHGLTFFVFPVGG